MNLFNKINHFSCYCAGCSCVKISQGNHPAGHKSARKTASHDYGIEVNDKFDAGGFDGLVMQICRVNI